MRVYLDNCVFNRPFDDQNQIRIRIESEAKLYIQDTIKNKNIELVWSYILEFENSQNPHGERRVAIYKWKAISSIFITVNSSILEAANKLVLIGVKPKDALHVACAIEGKPNYFITTDDRLNTKLNSVGIIQSLNPVDYIKEL